MKRHSYSSFPTRMVSVLFPELVLPLDSLCLLCYPIWTWCLYKKNFVHELLWFSMRLCLVISAFCKQSSSLKYRPNHDSGTPFHYGSEWSLLAFWHLFGTNTNLFQWKCMKLVLYVDGKGLQPIHNAPLWWGRCPWYPCLWRRGSSSRAQLVTPGYCGRSTPPTSLLPLSLRLQSSCVNLQLWGRPPVAETRCWMREWGADGMVRTNCLHVSC